MSISHLRNRKSISHACLYRLMLGTSIGTDKIILKIPDSLEVIKGPGVHLWSPTFGKFVLVNFFLK